MAFAHSLCRRLYDTRIYEGNLETAFLVKQVTSLRSALRFLRSENSYLKSHDLLSTLDSLPTYSLPPTPPLTPEPPSDSDDSPSDRRSAFLSPPSPVKLPAAAFATRSKLLLREARLLSATPRLVDVSQIAPVSADGRKSWQPARRDPRNQLWAEKERARQLERKMRVLMQERPEGAARLPWVEVGAAR
ncbi:hypothetical protein JCM8097_005546 [Rhodosporidiobolus ruineniae]